MAGVRIASAKRGGEARRTANSGGGPGVVGLHGAAREAILKSYAATLEVWMFVGTFSCSDGPVLRDLLSDTQISHDPLLKDQTGRQDVSCVREL